MANEGAADSLEERRFALEERKAQHDYELRKLELDLKGNDNGWLSRISPLTATIFAGILTLAGTVFGAYWQASSALQQEIAKDQHDLIVKMITGATPEQAQRNLLFLANNSLLDKTLAASVRAYAATLSNVPVIPAGGVAAPASPFDAIRTDDDAINLVLSEEGAFSMTGNDPNTATNYGVSLSQLSSYLGRTATIDDLKNLSRSTAIDLYKKAYGPPISSITSPPVRAAYFNLAVWTGVASAIKALQDATGRVLGKAVTTDGVMSADSVSLINSAPDPDLLVETVNCIELDNLKKNPNYSIFKAGFINRLRAFSPATLHGVCPELQPTAVAGTTNASPATADK